MDFQYLMFCCVIASSGRGQVAVAALYDGDVGEAQLVGRLDKAHTRTPHLHEYVTHLQVCTAESLLYLWGYRGAVRYNVTLQDNDLRIMQHD